CSLQPGDTRMRFARFCVGAVGRARDRGDRPRNPTASGRRRNPLAFDGLDRRVLLSSTWVGGSVGPAATPPSDSTPTVAIQGSFRTVWDSPTPVGYTPQQIRHAYGFDQIPLDGSGPTIAILEPGHDPKALSDLMQFDRLVEAPQVIPDPPSFTQVNEFSENTNYPTIEGAALSAETSLDIEWAHAMAPGASILLVEFNMTPGILPGTWNSSSGDIANAINTARNSPGVVAVSMSFGTRYTLFDSSFTTPGAHLGVTFVASTGDDGGVPQLPAASPSVVA